MDAYGRSSGCGGCGGGRARRAGTLSAPHAAGVALAACLVAMLPVPAMAQNSPAPAAPKSTPAKPKPPAAKPAPAPPSPVPFVATTGPQPDYAFAEFQRGHYLTAFGLATKRIK